MTVAPSIAWNAAAGLATAGAAALPCLPLEAAGLQVRIRQLLSFWLGRERQAVESAPPVIESILDELGTSGWRLRRDSARAVAQIFAASRPAGVLEFGSGVSTIVFAALSQACGLSTRVVSIEENPAYAEKTRRLLRRYSLADRATVVVASVGERTIDGWRGFTYSPDDREIGIALDGVDPDLLFIDGPASWLLRRRDCRFGTLLLARRYAAARALFIADDAFRRRDKEILKRWGALDSVEVFGVVPVGRGLGVGAVHSSRRPASLPG